MTFELWTEKYRPKSLDEMVNQKDIVERLKSFVKARNVPHCIFAGPPGTGKTTAALCLAHDLYGDGYREHLMELNASDERGISVVRETVKTFARTRAIGEIPFKIMILDESDNMCLTEDTEVIVGKKDSRWGYRLRKIKDVGGRLRPRYVPMPSINLTTGMVEDDYGKCVDSGYADFYRITLEDDRTVEASGEHPFFVWDKDSIKKVRVSEIREGDVLVDYSAIITKECEICGRPTLNKRFCCKTCASIGHSIKMQGARNPMYGKPAWNKGKNKFSDPRVVKQGLKDEKNPSTRPEVKEQRRRQMKRMWQDPDIRPKLLSGGCNFWKEHKGVPDIEIMDRETAERKRILASFTYREKGIFLDSNYRRHLPKSDEVRCEICGRLIKKEGRNGIYVHHIDGDKKNNQRDNFILVCPRCHNVVLHKVAERSWSRGRKEEWSKYMKTWWALLKEGGEKRLKSMKLLTNGGAVKEIKHIGIKRAWNITMRKNQNFLLSMGLLTHNTSDAQQALRRTMERFTETCRFILICVSPDTRIVLPEEVELTIDEFKGYHKHEVLSVNERTYNIDEDIVTHYVQISPRMLGKRVLSLMTNTGRGLKLTEDHTVLTREGWKPAKELRKGDYIAIFPHLEDTHPSEDKRNIVNENDIKEVVRSYEVNRLRRKPLGFAKRLRELVSKDKERVKERAIELYNLMCSGIGLTKREKQILDFVPVSRPASRSEIQSTASLSRIRLVQLLKSLENKGYLKRIVDTRDSRIHYFIATGKEPLILRSLMDIKRTIENEMRVSVSYAFIRRVIKGEAPGDTTHKIISELKNKGLLPLTYDHKKIGAIARLTGFILGDGHLMRNISRVIFTGSDETLREVQKDVERIGFTPSKIQRKKIKGKFEGRIMEGTTTFFFVDSSALWCLLQRLDIPMGNKCKQAYHVPEWVRKGTRFVKREFLRGFFDAEMTSPLCYDLNFSAPTLSQHKVENFVDSGLEFMQQISELLSDFKVSVSSINAQLTGYTLKTGEKIFSITMILSSSNVNLFDFFRQIGFFYDRNKRVLARQASDYLRHKLQVIFKRQMLGETLVATVAANPDKSLRKIAQETDCSLDFLINQIKGKEAHLPRDFLSFQDWRLKYAIPDAELVWNEVDSIKGIHIDDVRDITCMKHHNFVGNGIVSHNCNYSGKIIEPIQSRCAPFRFTFLPREDLVNRLLCIAQRENVRILDDGLDAVLEVCEGDLRRAINSLQAAASIGKPINDDTVYSVIGRANPADVRGMIRLAMKGDFIGARERLREMILKYGVAGSDIIRQIHVEIFRLEIPERWKIKLADVIGEIDFRLVQGADEEVQLSALLARLVEAGYEMKRGV